jgi:hypothetical protein
MTADIVVSADNTPFMEWQSQLFHYSCVSTQGQPPIIVVHCAVGEELRPGFQRIVEMGGQVQRAPRFSDAGKGFYLPRNFIGTLLSVSSHAETLVLMDPDMIFVRSVEFKARAVSLDVVGYMDPGSPDYAEWLPSACERAGVSYADLLAGGSSGGVPYVIHSHDRSPLANTWLECLDACADPGSEAIPWIGLMWAFVMAAHKLRMPISQTENTILNWRQDGLPEAKSIIHYCLGDEFFDKRRDGHMVWSLPQRGEGTVSGRILEEIAAARRFYG